MRWYYTPYALPFIVSGIISLPVALVAWRRRRSVPGAMPLALFMLAMVEWSIGNALEMCSVDLAGKTFWTNVEYVGIVAVPVTWIAVALEFSGRGEWLTRRNVGLLLVIPAVTVLMIWTNSFHGLMRYNIKLDTSGPFSVITKTYGPWFWVHMAYSYVLLFIGTIMIARSLLGRAHLYKGQAAVFVVGILAPWISNVLYISGSSPVPRLDITPIAFTISGLAVVWGVLRYRLLDIVPVAWATVVEGMGSGVIVVDLQDRVVDMNPAAQRMTGWRVSQAIGRQVAEVLSPWPSIVEGSRDMARGSGELVLDANGEDLSYEFHFSPLLGSRRGLLGRLVVIHDITERKRTQAQLVQQQRTLATMEERERLARDLHDNIGQVLGYLNVQAQAAREQLSRGQTAVADSYLEGLAAVAQDAYGEVREYIRTMRGVTSPGWEFVPALEQFLRRFERNYGIRTELDVPDEIRDGVLEQPAEMQLMRIIQEAMANVRKHAEARQVRVRFAMLPGEVEVTVEDDGRGFDPVRPVGVDVGVGAAAREGEGFGLGIMRERAEEMGGSLEIHSAPGQGTTMRVRVPLRKDGDANEGSIG